MIDDKGVTILGIDLEQGKVIVDTPDGSGAVCDVDRWFDAFGEPCKTCLNARTFAFDLNGVRYDGTLDGMGDEAVVTVGVDGVARMPREQRRRLRHGPTHYFH